ncbi:MAG: AbrB/MazE/SpoVT family DNA-binding domain-containing protein [Opitutaceae bacterium]
MLVTSKGQVTIPQHIRNRHGMRPGTAVEFVTSGDKVLLRPKRRRANATDGWLLEARGALKGKSTDERMKLTRGED